MAIIKELVVNNERRALAAEGDRSLLSVLRDDLDLTGCKYGCGEGRCGSCTVLVDGDPVRSCRTRVSAAEGTKIQTIEGLASGDKLHPLQEAFLEAGALQCGYCTPGMILSALALLGRKPEPTRDEIVRHMDGNVCRCGIYSRIITAIEMVARAMKEDRR